MVWQQHPDSLKPSREAYFQIPDPPIMPMSLWQSMSLCPQAKTRNIPITHVTTRLTPARPSLHIPRPEGRWLIKWPPPMIPELWKRHSIITNVPMNGNSMETNNGIQDAFRNSHKKSLNHWIFSRIGLLPHAWEDPTDIFGLFDHNFR